MRFRLSSLKNKNKDILNMAKDGRLIIILECTDCKNRNYSTTKNKTKHSGRVEYKKFCNTCSKRTLHKETK